MGGSFTDSGEAGLGIGEGGFAAASAPASSRDGEGAAGLGGGDGGVAALLGKGLSSGGSVDKTMAVSSTQAATEAKAALQTWEAEESPLLVSSDNASTMVVVHHLKRAPAAWLARCTRWKVSGSGGLMSLSEPP